MGIIFLSCSGEAEKKAEQPGLSKTEAKQLDALGYFDRAPTKKPDKRDVTRVEEMAFHGVNLYSSRHRAEAYLIDNKGRVLHKWRAKNRYPSWMHAELQPNGDILVISKLSHVARYNWKSKLLWKRELAAHHDLAVGPDDKLFVITSTAKRYLYEDGAVRLLDNSITTLSKRGRFKKETRFYWLLRSMIPEQRLRRIKRQTAKGTSTRKIFQENRATDVFHTNSIQILPKAIPSRMSS